MLVSAVIRNKRVYVAFSDFDYFQPIIVVNFFATTSDPEVILDNTEIRCWNGVYFANLYDRLIPVRMTDNTPEFTEFIPVKKPRGKNYVWKNGEWKKSY